MKKTKWVIGLLALAVLTAGFSVIISPPKASASQETKYLGDLTPVQKGNLLYLVDTTERNTNISVGGIGYDKGICTHPGYEGPSELTYDISGLGYTVFCAVGGKDDSAGTDVGTEAIMGSKVRLQVYVDGVLKADSGLLAYPDTYSFRVDIAGCRELKLVSSDGDDSIYCDTTCWADAKLISLDVTSIEILNKPRTGNALGDHLDCTGAKLTVRYSDHSEKILDLTAEMISGYDAFQAGQQTLAVNYGGKTAALDIFVADSKKDFTTVPMDSWVVYGADSTDENPAFTPAINNAFEQKGPLCIADKTYETGFGVHPAGDGMPSLLTFQVKNCGYQYLSVVAGKDRSAGDGVGGADKLRDQCAISFDILVDDIVVDSSPTMFYGECYHFLVDIRHAENVTLRVNDVDGVMCDAASWCNPVLLNVPDGKVPPAPTGDSSLTGAAIFLLMTSAVVLLGTNRNRKHT